MATSWERSGDGCDGPKDGAGSHGGCKRFSRGKINFRPCPTRSSGELTTWAAAWTTWRRTLQTSLPRLGCGGQKLEARGLPQRRLEAGCWWFTLPSAALSLSSQDKTTGFMQPSAWCKQVFYHSVPPHHVLGTSGSGVTSWSVVLLTIKHEIFSCSNILKKFTFKNYSQSLWLFKNGVCWAHSAPISHFFC